MHHGYNVLTRHNWTFLLTYVFHMFFRISVCPDHRQAVDSRHYSFQELVDHLQAMHFMYNQDCQHSQQVDRQTTKHYLCLLLSIYLLSISINSYYFIYIYYLFLFSFILYFIIYTHLFVFLTYSPCSVFFILYVQHFCHKPHFDIELPLLYEMCYINKLALPCLAILYSV